MWLAFAKACCGHSLEAPAALCDTAAFAQAAEELAAQRPHIAACADVALQVGSLVVLLDVIQDAEAHSHINQGCMGIGLSAAALRHNTQAAALPGLALCRQQAQTQAILTDQPAILTDQPVSANISVTLTRLCAGAARPGGPRTAAAGGQRGCGGPHSRQQRCTSRTAALPGPGHPSRSRP